MHSKIITLTAAALLLGAPVVAAQAAMTNSHSASKFAPGHLQKKPGQASQFAPGHLQKKPGQASQFAPGHEKTQTHTTTGTGGSMMNSSGR